MTSALLGRPRADSRTRQFATFCLGDLLFGLPIHQVQEINRHVHVTRVPHAPTSIRGVINLRGDVVTVVNLRAVLGLAPAVETRFSRNVVIQSQGQLIGWIVDRIADILSIPEDQIAPAPANVAGVDGRFFRGVYTTTSEIVVVLDVEEVLSEC